LRKRILLILLILRILKIRRKEGILGREDRGVYRGERREPLIREILGGRKEEIFGFVIKSLKQGCFGYKNFVP
jgi:hypothetical protein